MRKAHSCVQFDSQTIKNLLSKKPGTKRASIRLNYLETHHSLFCMQIHPFKSDDSHLPPIRRVLEVQFRVLSRIISSDCRRKTDRRRGKRITCLHFYTHTFIHYPAILNTDRFRSRRLDFDVESGVLRGH